MDTCKRDNLGNASVTLGLLSYDSTPNFTIWNDIDFEDLMNAIHTCHTTAANQWANFIAIDYGKNSVDGKLCPNWERPYKIVKLTSKGAYYLEDTEGKQTPRPWNSNNLRKIDVARKYFLTMLKSAISDTGKTILTEHLLLVTDYLPATRESVALIGDMFLKGHRSLDILKRIRSFIHSCDELLGVEADKVAPPRPDEDVGDMITGYQPSPKSMARNIDVGPAFQAVDFLNGKLLCGCDDLNSSKVIPGTLQRRNQEFYIGEAKLRLSRR
ncbi:hypothetical protein Acr_29g0002640 [Actinidia rufa]|uniref:Uncharacterized protein n=1 Tax=Actinidia rufa TaxID=165716 RepID=A0A7J0HDM3_9ERIC|nr:hypothetical protein Acr_29g0002640 [Actinidia rufa]